MNRSGRICRVRRQKDQITSLKEVEMRITKFVRTAAVGLVLGLLTGWLFSVAVPSTAQTDNLTWCLAQHTGNFDLEYGKRCLIWPGTSDGRYALVTVEVPSTLNLDDDAKIEVIWEDRGTNEKDRRTNVQTISVGNSITLWAQSVEVRAIAAAPNVVGQYTITFNLCGL